MDNHQPNEFWQGVDQFNQRQFYACHDTLEALWMEASEPDRTFYQGILQIAVALYHLGNQNWRGSVVLMGEGMNRLSNYQPDYAEIDVEGFLTQTVQLLKHLQATGPEQVSTVIRQLGYGTEDNQPGEASEERAIRADIGFPTLVKNLP